MTEVFRALKCSTASKAADACDIPMVLHVPQLKESKVRFRCVKGTKVASEQEPEAGSIACERGSVSDKTQKVSE